MNSDNAQDAQTLKSQQKTRVVLSLSILQVHVTERCNKKCAHCYQDETATRNSELTFDQLSSLIGSYEDVCRVRGWRGQVTFAGGEPFIRSDFLPLLKEMTRWSSLRFAILTNGYHIDEQTAQQLREMNPAFIQISLEGGPHTHDQIRGEGDFLRCLKVLSILKRAGVRTLVSFTAHRDNFREFPIVAEHARQAGVNGLWADRLVPMGRGKGLDTLSPQETRALFEIMRHEQLRTGADSATKIVMRRSLQFLCSGDPAYRCTAGKSLLAVLPNGTVYPCRRLPIELGNVLVTPLDQIFNAGKAIHDTPSSCRQCEHFVRCNGGSRCIAYATHGRLSEVDPGCWFEPDGGSKPKPPSISGDPFSLV